MTSFQLFNQIFKTLPSIMCHDISLCRWFSISTNFYPDMLNYFQCNLKNIWPSSIGLYIFTLLSLWFIINKMKKAKIPQLVKEEKSIPTIQQHMTAHFLACTSIKSGAQTFPQIEMMWSCIIYSITNRRFWISK